MSSNDDFIQIIDDDEPLQTSSSRELPPWKILVVDDDEGVHSVTKLALKNLTILDRPLSLYHCYSVKETKEILQHNRDFAVILLDVVMETDDAGLQMVSYIRKEMQMEECRIILRTGQPGYAPELSIFNEYDINDYRTKAELTRNRLITSITAALRSYRQINTISENRRGLELIINATSYLMDRTAIRSFSQGVLTQLASLLNFPQNGIVCVQRGFPDAANPDGLFVAGAAGELSSLITHPIEDMHDTEARAAIEESIKKRHHIYGEDYCVIYLQSSDNEGAVYINTQHIPSEDDQRILEVFAANITACFNNVNMVERLNFAAYNDPLTLLPNRTRFIIELDHYANMAVPDKLVALIDISHFADLNEGLGIDAGNSMLMEFSKRLKSNLGEQCYIARLGADVFGIIGSETFLNPENLNVILSKPFQIQGMEIPVRTNIGLCRLTGNQVAGLTLLKHANIALTQAKQSNSSRFEYYAEEMEGNTRWRLNVIRRLHEDFDSRKLQLWYQPQIDLRNGKVWGLEALLRWPDAEQGFIQPPSTFIPLAEYSGLIIPIGDWVIEKACEDYAELKSLPDSPEYISVNVSIPQFRSSGFVGKVKDSLYRHQLEPNSLVLELTESLSIDDQSSVIDTLKDLQNAGIATSIDDFGTGYSSLSYLKDLPISCLKIDQAFVKDIRKEGEIFVGGDFADTILTLGNKMDLKVVAEGVETVEQMQYLRSIGCEIIQGFLYAKPMPMVELVKWLEHWNMEKGSDQYDWVI
ncbi:EAL domain-containing protein [Neptuniibacter sp.]|uniref:two-component system response regulator n=1 Tax=Neptuniibacter sp. TaxID=1962643 RepID=UPI0026358DF1|nr:EAL domain-containing protein [Neptuniibacter sp.]MCP4595867.1 EAL domain-containing protein [Neptuniibacter sp.]